MGFCYWTSSSATDVQKKNLGWSRNLIYCSWKYQLTQILLELLRLKFKVMNTGCNIIWIHFYTRSVTNCKILRFVTRCLQCSCLVQVMVLSILYLKKCNRIITKNCSFQGDLCEKGEELWSWFFPPVIVYCASKSTKILLCGIKQYQRYNTANRSTGSGKIYQSTTYIWQLQTCNSYLYENGPNIPFNDQNWSLNMAMP